MLELAGPRLLERQQLIEAEIAGIGDRHGGKLARISARFNARLIAISL
jgi:hypothetical protein